jgi:RimK-like ATPgrasp N-terminal domain
VQGKHWQLAQPLLFKLNPDTLDNVHYVNLYGDYSYLLSGYYDSLDAELSGLNVIPTTQDALDAYVAPIAMEKAKQGGLSIPEYEIVTDKFLSTPIMAYPVNPFFSKGELLVDAAALEERRNAVSMTGKYAVLCQRLKGDYRIDVLRCVMGQCLNESYEEFAAEVFRIFRIPLMRIRVIVVSKEYQLSAIEPLPYEDLTLNEKKLLNGLGTWQS